MWPFDTWHVEKVGDKENLKGEKGRGRVRYEDENKQTIWLILRAALRSLQATRGDGTKNRGLLSVTDTALTNEHRPRFVPLLKPRRVVLPEKRTLSNAGPSQYQSPTDLCLLLLPVVDRTGGDAIEYHPSLTSHPLPFPITSSSFYKPWKHHPLFRCMIFWTKLPAKQKRDLS